MVKASQERMKLHDEMADELLLLVGDSSGLKKKRNKSFIVLELSNAPSSRNKNAVSFLREWVSFMVSDWTLQHEADSLGLPTNQSEVYELRLNFPALDITAINSHSDFFQRLTVEAKQRAEWLQEN